MENPMKIRNALGLAVLLSVSSFAVAASAADLVLYDALDFAGHVAKAFEAKTGMTVDVVEPGSTGETLGKIAAEGDNPQFDILWVDGSAVMERMLQDKVLQPIPADAYANAKFTKLGETLVPASHAFLPTGASTTAIEVNTTKVSASDMPHSWADLEKFAGSVAAKDPNFSGPAFQWLAGLFQTNGEAAGKALLQKTLTNKTISGLSSGGKINKAVLTGDAKVGINQDSSIFSKIASGEPVVAVYPSEGSVALPEGLGIASNTKHMDAVKKFIAYVTSPEGQAAMQDGDDTDYFFIPIIDGVKAKPGRKTDISFVVLDDKAAAPHETEWKQWYKDNFAQ
jgi:iron(III) transport system substrate-binding protein